MTKSLYDDKALAYFDNARQDFIDLLPPEESSVLEIGCGTGSTALAALTTGRVRRYLGVEFNEEAAKVARDRGLDVLTANVEELDVTQLREGFDVIWASEVLEHLTDPWAVVRNLSSCLRHGGLIVASTPNVAHRSVIMGLLGNQFAYTESGLMDRSHLRWFTPASLEAMVGGAGLDVLRVSPSRRLNWKARAFDAVTFGKFTHLLHTQTILVAKKP